MWTRGIREVTGQVLKPVETLLEFMLRKYGDKLLEGEQARLLFHTRFALGFLLLAEGDKKRSKAVLQSVVRKHTDGTNLANC